MSIRGAAGFGLYRIGVAALSGLSPDVAHLAAERIGRRIFDSGGKRPEIALVNLRIAFPDLSEKERREIGRESFAAFARNLVDAIRSRHWSDEELKRRVTLEGMEHLRTALADGGGALVLSMHMGCFELASIVPPLYGVRSSVVARPLSNAFIYRDLVRSRSRTGTIVIDRRKAATSILRALRANRTVGILNDQYSRRRRAVFVPLFGVRCSTSAGLATIARRSRAPILTAYTFRDPQGQHVVRFGPPLEHALVGDRTKDVETITTDCNRFIERVVRENPTQYMWAHTRFRHSPDLAGDPYGRHGHHGYHGGLERRVALQRLKEARERSASRSVTSGRPPSS